jgi:hypothetical protein
MARTLQLRSAYILSYSVAIAVSFYPILVMKKIHFGGINPKWLQRSFGPIWAVINEHKLSL